jgi:hypothetical protein
VLNLGKTGTGNEAFWIFPSLVVEEINVTAAFVLRLFGGLAVSGRPVGFASPPRDGFAFFL